MEQRTPKPTLSLRKKSPASNPAPTSNVEPNPPQEYPDFTQERFPEWDIPVIEDVEPKRRKRRKDKHIEQYRKEARWQ
jgi:hypothetical protein